MRVQADKNLKKHTVKFFAVGLILTAMLIPVISWAFPPDMLPSPAIWSNFMQRVKEPSPKVNEVCTDGDGVPDLITHRTVDGLYYIDVQLKPGVDGMMVQSATLRETQKDKATWVYGFDKSGDGIIDMVVRGMFAEGKFREMIYDSDRDGRPDTFLLDTDSNGVFDAMGADTDSDGKIDTLYDLDNIDGKIINETIGWVVFTEQQRKEALPQLVYSFTPEFNTLNNQAAEIIGATWDYGDGAIRDTESMVPGEHLYAKPGEFEVQLEVQFKVTGNDKVQRAWFGIALPVVAGPPGPPPMNLERVLSSTPTFFGACGLLMAQDKPREGTITELYPDVVLPEGAPVGQALQAGAIAPGELDLAIFWWRSDAEAMAFLDTIEKANPLPALPLTVVRDSQAKAFELVSKVRSHLRETGTVRTTAWREGAFVMTLTSNRSVDELTRWTRLLHDILHPAADAQPTVTPVAATTLVAPVTTAPTAPILEAPLVTPVAP